MPLGERRLLRSKSLRRKTYPRTLSKKVKWRIRLDEANGIAANNAKGIAAIEANSIAAIEANGIADIVANG